MSSKKIKVPMENIGYGFVGVWTGDPLNEKVGWFLPDHLSGTGRKYPDSPALRAKDYVTEGDRPERFFLCQITASPVLDKKGRPITRIVRPKKEAK